MLKQSSIVLCPPAGGSATCPPSRCRVHCGLEVLDTLLSTPGAVAGEEADALLDLRFQLRARTDAEAALRLFCELRRRLEHRHYLAFYRLRRWLETQVVAMVNTSGGEPAVVPLRLDFYCVEPVRRSCLCAAVRHANLRGNPRLFFGFVPLPETAGVNLAAKQD